MITVNITPTWSALLPMMLDLHAQLITADSLSDEQRAALVELRLNFRKMATAADHFNEFIEQQNQPQP